MFSGVVQASGSIVSTPLAYGRDLLQQLQLSVFLLVRPPPIGCNNISRFNLMKT
jgi:hypothetical protein